jgi:hypothetical protein
MTKHFQKSKSRRNKMSNKDLHLEISKLIGAPINTQLPVPVELAAIADVATAEPGEHVYRIENLDTVADVILDLDADGVITPVKRTPGSDVELTFKGLNSKQEYVMLNDVLNSVDQNALARRKASISRGMDKLELKIILDALVTPASAYYPANKIANAIDAAAVSAEDLYDVIVKAKQAVEDYGDKFLLLCGKNVKAKIDTYEKDNATSFNYLVGLEDKLAKMGITVMKVFGQVSNATNEAEVDLLDANMFILISQNSRIADGKPVKFIRRKITADIAAEAGLVVDAQQRGVLVTPSPVQVVVSGTRQSVWAYGVIGFESVIFCVTNPLAIAKCDCSAIL